MSTSNIGLKQTSSQLSHKESAALGTTDSGVWCWGPVGGVGDPPFRLCQGVRGQDASVSAVSGREDTGSPKPSEPSSVLAGSGREEGTLPLRSGCVRAWGGRPAPSVPTLGMRVSGREEGSPSPSSSVLAASGREGSTLHRSDSGREGATLSSS